MLSGSCVFVCRSEVRTCMQLLVRKVRPTSSPNPPTPAAAATTPLHATNHHAQAPPSPAPARHAVVQPRRAVPAGHWCQSSFKNTRGCNSGSRSVKYGIRPRTTARPIQIARTGAQKRGWRQNQASCSLKCRFFWPLKRRLRPAEPLSMALRTSRSPSFSTAKGCSIGSGSDLPGKRANAWSSGGTRRQGEMAGKPPSQRSKANLPPLTAALDGTARTG